MSARPAICLASALLLAGCLLDVEPTAVEGEVALAVDSFGGVGDELWSFESPHPGAQLGWSVAVIGDTNGDGYEDVAVGCRWCNEGQNREGLVEFFYGSASGPSVAPDETWESNYAEAWMGASVDGGDLNGDGFVELIVGLPQYGSDEEGAVWIYEGSSTGISSGPVVQLSGSVNNGDFGWSVAGAGDLNGDGYGDLAVGAPVYLGSGGEVHVFYGAATLGAMSTGPDWTFSPAGSVDLGWSVDAAGDVNGDGYGDLVVGDADHANIGRAYVFHGSFGGLIATEAWSSIASGAPGGSDYGSSVAGVGDVDGDGYADVLVGAPDWSTDGGAWLYYGSISGLSSSHGWSWGPTISGSTTRFGEEVSEAGDVNGDGYADFLVGAYGWDGPPDTQGKAFLWYGDPSRPTTSTADWTLLGGEEDTRLGESLDGGDVNGDGFSDLLIGAPYRNTPAVVQLNEGAVQLFPGGASGPVAGNIGSTSDWLQQGGAAGDQLGFSVESAGDVNADGFDDVVVGAPYLESTLTDEGGIYVHTGTATGLDASPWLELAGGQANASFGHSVAGVGDVDGDGFGDIAVGAPGWSDGAGGVGAVFLVPGGASPPTAPSWSFVGAQAGDGLGFSVARAGDVNGDGFPDVAAGAPLWNTTGSDVGAALVFHGSATGLPPTASWTVTGSYSSDQLGYSLDCAGDVDGDLIDDLIVGVPGWNDGFGAAGKASIFLGSTGGLATTEYWSSTGGGTGREHGHAVAGIGYFDSDDLADVVVGRWRHTGIGTWSGRALVYAGDASAMSTSPLVTFSGAAAYDELGGAVDGAGDVNCDGWADVVIGAAGADSGDTDAGEALIWFGGPSDSAYDWEAFTSQAGATLGFAVAGAGDVNGDGCDDVIVGAPMSDVSGADNGTDNEGLATLFLGNTDDAGAPPPFAWTPRALEPVTLRQIDPGGRSASTSFQASLQAVTPFGRRDVKVQLEVKEAGVPFDGAGLIETASWLDTDVYGQAATLLADSLTEGVAYHWRARLLLRAIDQPPQRALRWVYGGRGGDNEAVHLRAGCSQDTDGDGICNGDDIDDDGDGYADGGDCDPLDPLQYPGAPEECNGEDDGCAGAVPANEADADGDGVRICEGDCLDTDATYYPGAPEDCDLADQNCDGDVSEEVDDDFDGQAECEGDCDDGDFLVRVGFPVELCDGQDNDCDGLTPTAEQDADADGWRICEGDCDDTDENAFPGAEEDNSSPDDLNCDGIVGEADWDGDGYDVENGLDCDDDDPAVNPGATELCDSVDNDCDGELLPGELLDVDGDGALACDDCDDGDASIHPTATEICNGLDDNCNGVLLATEYDADDDGVTECGGDCDDYNPLIHPGQVEICGNGFDDDCVGGVDVDSDVDSDGVGACSGDCDDFDGAVHPGATEICNGVDDDCDGSTDEGFDVDGDGVTVCAGDCDDTESTVYAGAPAICPDGLDNDCDPATLEGLDADGDGYFACSTDGSPPDCWEGNPSVYPGAVEVCDFVDNDCGGTIDEGFDVDGDGWTTCRGDCDDAEPQARPGLAEVCGDGIDNDCAGDGDAVCPGDDDDSAGDDDDSTGDDDDVADDDDVVDDDDSAADDDDSAADDDDVVDDDDSAADDDDVVDDDDSVTDDDDDVVDDDDSVTDDDDDVVDDDDSVTDDDDDVVDDDDSAADDDSAGVPVLLPPGCVCGGASLTGRGAAGGWLAIGLLLGLVTLRRRS